MSCGGEGAAGAATVVGWDVPVLLLALPLLLPLLLALAAKWAGGGASGGEADPKMEAVGEEAGVATTPCPWPPAAGE